MPAMPSQMSQSQSQMSMRFPLRDALMSDSQYSTFSGSATSQSMHAALRVSHTKTSQVRREMGRTRRHTWVGPESQRPQEKPQPPPHRTPAAPKALPSKGTHENHRRVACAEADGFGTWQIMESASAPQLTPDELHPGTWSSAARAVVAHSRLTSPEAQRASIQEKAWMGLGDTRLVGVDFQGRWRSGRTRAWNSQTRALASVSGSGTSTRSQNAHLALSMISTLAVLRTGRARLRNRRSRRARNSVRVSRTNSALAETDQRASGTAKGLGLARTSSAASLKRLPERHTGAQRVR